MKQKHVERMPFHFQRILESNYFQEIARSHRVANLQGSPERWVLVLDPVHDLVLDHDVLVLGHVVGLGIPVVKKWRKYEHSTN